MQGQYFSRVFARTPTRLWINNPTGDDLTRALNVGCIAGTTNPSYCAKLIDQEPEFILPIIDEEVQRHEDDSVAADRVVQAATRRFMDAFRPIHGASGGTLGFVTIQDDPARDHSAERIVEAALVHQRVGPNYMAKVPVTEAGMEAMDELISRRIPVCATECFGLDQAITMCERYERAVARGGHRPPFFITHITGIFDDELKDFAARHNVQIKPEILNQAGCLVGRKQYHVLRERGFPAVMLGGGARGLHHFTAFVGGQMHITLNWSTIEELLDADEPGESRIDELPADDVVAELCDKLPDFRRAWHEGSLRPEEFESFAPLQRFRNNFLAGYGRLREEVARRRAAAMARP
ncbi:MAG TPA: transaldolase family protein [Candidatus Sumerlaeota bacterium]|nr:transaldolase family protein [Candidatus Sumerlaeota bacterium]